MFLLVFCFLRIAISVSVSGLSIPMKTPMKFASFISLRRSASSDRFSDASVVNSNG